MDNHPLVQTNREGFFTKCLRKLLLWLFNPSDEYPLMKTFLNGPAFPSLSNYPSLDSEKREIRLVDLLPGKGWDPLECHLRIVSLDDKPHYTALSYACGTGIWVPTIKIEGQQVAIKPNLGKALKRLRHPTETFSIWIDAISIDQNNDVEKAAQVAMMEQIYQGCALVYIWMGDVFIPGVDTDNGMQLCRRSIHEMAPNEWSTIGNENAVLTSSRPGESRQSDVHGAFQIIQSLAQGRHIGDYSWYTDRSEETAAMFNALRTFVMLHWWERIWTVQEPIYPPQAIVVWGPYTAPWAMFADAAHSFNHHIHSCCVTVWVHFWQGLYKTLLTLFADNISELERAKGELASSDLLGIEAQLNSTISARSSPSPSTRPPRKLTLTELLWRFRNRRATDERDLIYALFGLVQKWHSDKRLMPSYSFATATQDVWGMAISESLGRGDFRLLMGKRQPCGQPSWIPAWNQWTDNGTTINTNDVDAAEKQFMTYSFYNTSKGYEFHSSSDSSPLQDSKLKLSGFFIDTIRDVGAVQQARVRKHITTAATIVEWLGLIVQPGAEDDNRSQSQPDVGHSILSQNEAFWRTMCRDVLLDDGGTRRAVADDGELFDDYIKLVAFEQVRDGNIDWSLVEKMMNTVYLMTYNSRFFVTEKGCFGLGHKDVERGDEVWVLRGGRVPFLLRREERDEDSAGGDLEFRLKGDCYVHGVMDGEWIEGATPSEKIVELV